MANLYTVLKNLQEHVAAGGFVMKPADPGEDWLDPLTGKHWPPATCERALQE